MHITIFEGDKKLAKGLVPENNPVDIVNECEIGITNMSAKTAGLIGDPKVKLQQSPKNLHPLTNLL